MKRNVNKAEFFFGRAVSFVLGFAILAFFALAPSCQREDVKPSIEVGQWNTNLMESSVKGERTIEMELTANKAGFIYKVKVDDIKVTGELMRYRIHVKMQGPGYVSIPSMTAAPYEVGIKYSEYNMEVRYNPPQIGEGYRLIGFYKDEVSANTSYTQIQQKAEELLNYWVENTILI